MSNAGNKILRNTGKNGNKNRQQRKSKCIISKLLTI